VRHRGRLLSQEALLRRVWGAAHAEDRQTLRAHVTNLRRKLGAPSATGVTRTYPGVGYLLEDHPTANCAAIGSRRGFNAAARRPGSVTRVA
jgi:DNA-binding response OmpR family regulator